MRHIRTSSGLALRRASDALDAIFIVILAILTPFLGTGIICLMGKIVHLVVAAL